MREKERCGPKGRRCTMCEPARQARYARQTCEASQNTRGTWKHARHKHWTSYPFPFYWVFVRVLALFRSTRAEFFFHQSTLLVGISKECQACTTSNNWNFCTMCVIVVPVKFVVKNAGSVSSRIAPVNTWQCGFCNKQLLDTKSAILDCKKWDSINNKDKRRKRKPKDLVIALDAAVWSLNFLNPITHIVLLLCIVHALVHTIVPIALLLPLLPLRLASVLDLHFDSLLVKRGRSFEVSAWIIGAKPVFGRSFIAATSSL